MDTPPLSRHLLRVSEAHELLHGIKAGSLDDDRPSPPPMLNTCLAKVATREGTC